MSELKYEKTPKGNYWLQLDRPSNGISFNDGALWSPDTDKGETAVVYDNKYYIVNGDFRDEYLDAYKKHGVEGVLVLYEELSKTLKSSWSD